MVARYSVAGRTTEKAGRNHHRRIRVSLVGTADERAGDLHGRRNTRNLRERLTRLILILRLQLQQPPRCR